MDNFSVTLLFLHVTYTVGILAYCLAVHIESLLLFSLFDPFSCSLCWNSCNIHGRTAARPYLYVQLLAGVLLCRAILIAAIGLG